MGIYKEGFPKLVICPQDKVWFYGSLISDDGEKQNRTKFGFHCEIGRG